MRSRRDENFQMWVAQRSGLRLPGVVLLLAFLHFASGAGLGQTVDGQNIAPLTPYVLTPAPNYGLATGVPDKVLTDGRRPTGRFWVGSDSVGWYWKSPVVYRQTFRTDQIIRRIELGTGQALGSEISLPANAFVYVSKRDDRWVYVGDAGAAGRVADGTHTLSVDFAPVEARSIAIVFYRASPYMFLDEVRILAAAGGRPATATAETSDFIGDASARRRAFAEKRAGVGPLGANVASRVGWPLEPNAPIGRRCRVSRIAPWTEGDPTTLMRADAYAGTTVHAVGGWLSGLIRIENPSPEPMKVDLKQSGGAGTAGAELLLAQYVLALDYRWRADVLVPKQELIVPPRSMSLLVVRARVESPGEVRVNLEVGCGGERAPITIFGRAEQIEAGDRPYGNTWSYLIGPSRNLGRCRTVIHEDAWIDTAVVEAAALTPRRGAIVDAKLRTYLRVFAQSRRMLLFMDVNDAAWTRDNGAQLELELRAWWAWVSKAIREEGYKGEVLIYPIDEITSEQLPRLDATVRALRQIAPSVPIYATIDNVGAAESTAGDFRQFHDRVLTRISPTTPRGRSPQLYATAYYGKALGLSTYYRRLSWLAFGAGLEGAGVWSMWEGSGADQPQFGWSDFGGVEKDFSLVYADPSGCPLPSRRLMAFQRGLEDFALMNACVRRGGGAQIRTVVRTTAQSAIWDSIRKSTEQAAPAFDPALAQLLENCKPGSN